VRREADPGKNPESGTQTWGEAAEANS
jgi:hypothetical protein